MASEPAISAAAAVGILLTVEGFLLATVSLAASIGAPGQKRVRNWILPPRAMANLAIGLMIVVAFAGVVNWWSIYGGESVRPFSEATVAVVVLVSIIVQPVIGFLLAAGLRVNS